MITKKFEIWGEGLQQAWVSRHGGKDFRGGGKILEEEEMKNLTVPGGPNLRIVLPAYYRQQVLFHLRFWCFVRNGRKLRIVNGRFSALECAEECDNFLGICIRNIHTKLCSSHLLYRLFE